MKLNGDVEKDSSSSDDDMDRDYSDDGESSDDDKKEKGIEDVVLPAVMPKVTLSSDDDSDDDQAKGFLANTMGLLKDQKAMQQATNNNSKIASDLDALFSKFV